MLVLIAVIGVLAAIAIPSFVNARSTAQQHVCVNNLRLLDAAKEQLALEKVYEDGNFAGLGLGT